MIIFNPKTRIAYEAEPTQINDDFVVIGDVVFNRISMLNSILGLELFQDKKTFEREMQYRRERLIAEVRRRKMYVLIIQLLSDNKELTEDKLKQIINIITNGN